MNSSTSTVNNAIIQVNIASAMSPISNQVTTSPSVPVSVPLEKFELFEKLAPELRRMIIKEALPAPAIIVLKHETQEYTSKGQKERTVRFIPEFSMIFDLSDLRKSRAMALMKVNVEFRDVYLEAHPHHIKICQARRERKQSKLRFSSHDVLYLSSFFGRIPLERTFKAIKNTIAPALPFKHITRLAFSGAVLVRLSENALHLAQFMETFPALKEIKILDHVIPAETGFKKYWDGGSHGASPDPKETHLRMDAHWVAQVDELLNSIKAQLGAEAAFPKITFL